MTRGISLGAWLTPLGRCQAVGPGTRVRGRPLIENRGRIEIGRDLALRAQPVPVHFVTAPGATLTIGDRVTIAHGVGISAHARVDIGDDTVIGAFAMLLDTDFHVADDRRARPACTPIRVGNGVHIGAHVTVLRGTVIGDGAVIASGSVVGDVVPAGSHVAGVPARPAETADDGDTRALTADAVCAVVARALGLATLPSADAECAAIREWDSLGALNVMLSLEAAFGLEFLPDDMARVRRVSDLVSVLSARTPRAWAVE